MVQETPRRRRPPARERLLHLPGLKRFLKRGVLDVTPRLDGPGPDRVSAAIEEALERNEPASRRRAAARVLQAYAGLDDAGRSRFFELVATRFGVDDLRLDSAVERLRTAGPGSRDAAVRALRRVLTPRYTDLLHVVTGLPGGVKMLVDLRADLLALSSDQASVGLLGDELAGHLSSVFDVGLLELRRMTWETTSGALLERLMRYEAVHEIDGWEDLKNRLDSDRRCYAFLHPAMPDEPLVFVEIALTAGMAGDVPRLLDLDVADTDPADADTAIFYSITNCQPGLARVNLGNELIKRVVQELRRDLPQLRTYATLSPMPGFRSWAEEQLRDGAVTAGEREAFGEGAANVAAALADDRWIEDPVLSELLRPGMLSMAARYLTTPHHGRVLDPVGHFHLSNGADVDRVNWLANPASYELRRSFGMMVNYRYDTDHLEENVEQYLATGAVKVSGQVRALVR